MYGPKILLIAEDSAALRRRAEVLEGGGHEVEVAAGRNQGILACSAQTFDLIVIEAGTDAEAQNLALDIAVVAPASEIVNVNQWHSAGLDAENEPGFLLSLVTMVRAPGGSSRR